MDNVLERKRSRWTILGSLLVALLLAFVFSIKTGSCKHTVSWTVDIPAPSPKQPPPECDPKRDLRKYIEGEFNYTVFIGIYDVITGTNYMSVSSPKLTLKHLADKLFPKGVLDLEVLKAIARKSQIGQKTLLTILEQMVSCGFGKLPTGKSLKDIVGPLYPGK